MSDFDVYAAVAFESTLQIGGAVCLYTGPSGVAFQCSGWFTQDGEFLQADEVGGIRIAPLVEVRRQDFVDAGVDLPESGGVFEIAGVVYRVRTVHPLRESGAVPCELHPAA